MSPGRRLSARFLLWNRMSSTEERKPCGRFSSGLCHDAGVTSPARFSTATPFTSIFLHGGWLHLVGNMLFLLLCGPYVEDVYGRLLFAALFFGSGIAGDAATRSVEPGSFVPSYGASGAIAGVMGAFLVRFTTRRLRFSPSPLSGCLWCLSA